MNNTSSSSSSSCQGKSCHKATPRTFKRIVIALDGSEQSDAAASMAARLAGQLHADVVLMNVFQAPYLADPRLGLLAEEARVACIEAARDLLDNTKAKMPASSQVETVLREGDPAEEILKAAVIYAADLIVMGTHGRGRIAQAVLGSVAQAVTKKATCPVLTVSHPFGEKKEAAESRQTAFAAPAN